MGWRQDESDGRVQAHHCQMCCVASCQQSDGATLASYCEIFHIQSWQTRPLEVNDSRCHFFSGQWDFTACQCFFKKLLSCAVLPDRWFLVFALLCLHCCFCQGGVLGHRCDDTFLIYWRVFLNSITFSKNHWLLLFRIRWMQLWKVALFERFICSDQLKVLRSQLS